VELLDAGRLPGRLLPAAPILLARLASSVGAGRAALVARASEPAVLAGALELLPEGASARRHSGGPAAVVEPGDYLLVALYPGGLAEAAREAARLAPGGRAGWGVAAAGETMGYGYLEVYARRDPAGLVPWLGGPEEEAPFDLGDWERVAARLSSPEWLDPPPGPAAVRVEAVSGSGYRLALAGSVDVEAGVVEWTMPDHWFYAYPPGPARAVFREVSGVPPARSLAVHVVNALYGAARVWGAEPGEVLELVEEYVERASGLLG